MFSNYTAEELEEICARIKVPSSEVAGVEVSHGTAFSEVGNILRSGPLNYGDRNVGGAGLNVTYRVDDTIARDYAHNHMLSDSGRILDGHINPQKDFRVARIRLDRFVERVDIVKNAFPIRWVSDPALRAAVLENFDIVIVEGLIEARVPIGFKAVDSFLVIHESAGKNSIIWTNSRAILESLRVRINQPPLALPLNIRPQPILQVVRPFSAVNLSVESMNFTRTVGVGLVYDVQGHPILSQLNIVTDSAFNNYNQPQPFAWQRISPFISPILHAANVGGNIVSAYYDNPRHDLSTAVVEGSIRAGLLAWQYRWLSWSPPLAIGVGILHGMSSLAPYVPPSEFEMHVRRLQDQGSGLSDEMEGFIRSGYALQRFFRRIDEDRNNTASRITQTPLAQAEIEEIRPAVNRVASVVNQVTEAIAEDARGLDRDVANIANTINRNVIQPVVSELKRGYNTFFPAETEQNEEAMAEPVHPQIYMEREEESESAKAPVEVKPLSKDAKEKKSEDKTENTAPEQNQKTEDPLRNSRFNPQFNFNSAPPGSSIPAYKPWSYVPPFSVPPLPFAPSYTPSYEPPLPHNNFNPHVPVPGGESDPVLPLPSLARPIQWEQSLGVDMRWPEKEDHKLPGWIAGAGIVISIGKNWKALFETGKMVLNWGTLGWAAAFLITTEVVIHFLNKKAASKAHGRLRNARRVNYQCEAIDAEINGASSKIDSAIDCLNSYNQETDPTKKAALFNQLRSAVAEAVITNANLDALVRNRAVNKDAKVAGHKIRHRTRKYCEENIGFMVENLIVCSQLDDVVISGLTIGELQARLQQESRFSKRNLIEYVLLVKEVGLRVEQIIALGAKKDESTAIVNSLLQQGRYGEAKDAVNNGVFSNNEKENFLNQINIYEEDDLKQKERARLIESINHSQKAIKEQLEAKNFDEALRLCEESEMSADEKNEMADQIKSDKFRHEKHQLSLKVDLRIQQVSLATSSLSFLNNLLTSSAIETLAPTKADDIPSVSEMGWQNSFFK